MKLCKYKLGLSCRGAKRGGAWEQCSQKEIDRIDLGRRIWDKSTPLVTISVNRVIYPIVTDGANRMNYSSAVISEKIYIRRRHTSCQNLVKMSIMKIFFYEIHFSIHRPDIELQQNFLLQRVRIKLTF